MHGEQKLGGEPLSFVSWLLSVFQRRPAVLSAMKSSKAQIWSKIRPFRGDLGVFRAPLRDVAALAIRFVMRT